jgi:hypothetical protein
MALNSMSIDKLMKLKEQVEAALSSKVIEQRHALESELSKLSRLAVRTRHRNTAPATIICLRTSSSRPHLPSIRPVRVLFLTTRPQPPRA